MQYTKIVYCSTIYVLLLFLSCCKLSDNCQKGNEKLNQKKKKKRNLIEEIYMEALFWLSAQGQQIFSILSSLLIPKSRALPSWRKMYQEVSFGLVISDSLLKAPHNRLACILCGSNSDGQLYSNRRVSRANEKKKTDNHPWNHLKLLNAQEV